MRSPVSVSVMSATGKARAWIYAVWVCDGYNPYDRVFWGIYDNGNGPSDTSWAIIAPSIAKELAYNVTVPADILD